MNRGWEKKPVSSNKKKIEILKNDNAMDKANIKSASSRKERNKIISNVNKRKKRIKILEESKEDRKTEIKKASNKEIQHHFKRFESMILPEYIRKNLADMPNNRGYVYKGYWYFGVKPIEPGQPTIMVEKKGNGVMMIHEYTDREYKIYEKKGKNKNLISKKRRIKQKDAPDLLVEI